VYLQTLLLINFRNYSKAQFSFSNELNFLTGGNGSGKTSVLDAIHYLCLGKSYFHYSDQNSVKHEENFFRLEGNFANEETHRITCAFQSGNKKELQKNGILYPRIADHVGLIPIVMITPDDQLLIDEGSDERRRFIDNTLSQIDHSYLESLIDYNRVLQQRNAALKSFYEKRKTDRSLIETFDQQLAPLGKKIFALRENHFSRMIPMLSKYYELLSDNQENVTACYNSVCRNEDLISALHNSFEKDCATQRTSEGIHRDDFDFFLNNRSLKKFGSQGQKKSFLMSIKFSQFELIREGKNRAPLLLLDDLFDKLDKSRASNILQLIAENDFGQVFITDTNDQRVRDFISESKKASVHFEIADGLPAPSS